MAEKNAYSAEDVSLLQVKSAEHSCDCSPYYKELKTMVERMMILSKI